MANFFSEIPIDGILGLAFPGFEFVVVVLFLSYLCVIQKLRPVR